MDKSIHQLDKITSSVFAMLFLFILLSVAIVSNLSVSATDGNTTVDDIVTAIIEPACTLSGTGADSHTALINPGTWTPDIGISNMTAICNDANGYAIYAIGYSNDSYDSNINTKLYATVGTDTYTISTDNYTASPSDSFWSMKLAQGTGDAATIISPYSSYSAVPSTYTKVATYPASTTGTSGSSFTSTYGVYPSLTQAAGTYTGQVKYVLLHPNSSTPGTYTIAYNANGGSGNMTSSTPYTFDEFTLPDSTFTAPTGYKFTGWCTMQDQTQSPQTVCSGASYDAGDEVTGLAIAGGTVDLYAYWEKIPTVLYNTVAAMTKGTQTVADLKNPITTDNSGVYTYNTSAFGDSSDASNDNAIYYYRGILDSNLDGTENTYGSNGDGVVWPNYVILDADGTKTTSDTCWRIVRTTGSGGIKMMYNGLWNGSSCANPTSSAQLASTSNYNGNNNTYERIVLVGYTYNSTYNSRIYNDTSVDLVFGSNSDYSGNTSNSTIKNNIDTWYNNNLSAYTSILEPSAGYCNDRTAYSDPTTNTPLSTIVPYSTSSATMYFGAHGRNMNATSAGKSPSLTCPADRNIVDLYTTNSASNGNKQLANPVALLTADELSFAGSGNKVASRGSAYHYSSYLRSGSPFWTLSPEGRYYYGYALGLAMAVGGYINDTTVTINNPFGVRPAISLSPGATANSGSGTAVDPWVITAP